MEKLISVFKKVIKGASFYASVELIIQKATSGSKIFVDSASTNYQLDNLNLLWGEAAKIGAEHALRLINPKENIVVNITNIHGIIVDTNPTVIGVASFLGIYEYFKIKLSDYNLSQIEKYVYKSKGYKNLTKLPNMKKLNITSKSN